MDKCIWQMHECEWTIKAQPVANLSQGAVVTFLELHLLQELREHPRVLQLWALLGQCHLHTAEPERNTNAHASEHRSLNTSIRIEAETHTSSPRRSGVQEAAECEDVFDCSDDPLPVWGSAAPDVWPPAPAPAGSSLAPPRSQTRGLQPETPAWWTAPPPPTTPPDWPETAASAPPANVRQLSYQLNTAAVDCLSQLIFSEMHKCDPGP